ncbi:SGNH/GDSL hydrolase family protein [Vibrio alginolyticus]|uniref:SGNH/GDSL hydrolase family protein n=1 Tax=Vibrio alginolyticus TaxID=663 RepID=UPI002160E02B|nr:SGNH/GDSL hydrolase family protein [Vibrio alginolyticus]MCS0183256.1 SGNH/GDSL hydrolase family protein [Vibrio alginolyticus]
MTKNIEQRTEDAVIKYEHASGTVDDIANKDDDVKTGAGYRKSFPKISREWEIESSRIKQEWQGERDQLSIKALGVKTWEAGQSENNINQQRRWTDNNTYLPKSLPAVMDESGPDDNWIPYVADKGEVLTDVFGNKPLDLISGMTVNPDTERLYPKIQAFGITWEIDNGDSALEVDTFEKTSDGYLVITLVSGAKIIAHKVNGATRNWVQRKQALWVNTRDIDYEQIHARLGQRAGMKMAFLGDSIMAGVGSASGVYGEAQKEWLTFPSMLSASLVFADPGFLRVENVISEGDGKFMNHLSGVNGLPYLKFELPKGQAKLTLRGQDSVKAYPDITLYYYSSSLSDYTDFTVHVYENGTLKKTETVKAVRDRFVIDGVVDIDVQPQLSCHRIELGYLAYQADIVIENNSDGKVVQLVGVATGRGVCYRNFGVSSMTLKNDSSANISRGVTTDGQIQKVVDYKADYIFINWGTNDSKSGVSSVSEYKYELTQRILELRQRLPNAKVILCSYPKGRPGSAYQYNEAYALALHEVAENLDVTVVDVLSLFKLNDLGGSYSSDYNIYADKVHPSQVGYALWASSVCSKLKIPFYSKTLQYKPTEVTRYPRGGELKFNHDTAINPSSSGPEVKEIFTGEILNEPDSWSNIYLTALVRCGATVGIEGDVTISLEMSSDDGSTWFEKDTLTLESHMDQTKFTQFSLRCHHSGQKEKYKFRITGSNYFIRGGIESRVDWQVVPR